MDTAKRIVAVRERLHSLKREEITAQRAGPSCSTCTHRAEMVYGYPAKAVPACAHVAYTRQGYLPDAGKFVDRVSVPTEAARAQDGLCGPEGLLHSPAANPIVERAKDGAALCLGAALLYGFLFH